MAARTVFIAATKAASSDESGNNLMSGSLWNIKEFVPLGVEFMASSSSYNLLNSLSIFNFANANKSQFGVTNWQAGQAYLNV
jgi:hypothetical protein